MHTFIACIFILLGFFPALASAVTPMLSANGNRTVALRSDGTVVAWGDNSAGALGDGTTTARSSPVSVPGLTGVVAVSAGDIFNVALKSDGTVVTWGYNNSGQLGDGTTTDRHSPVTVPGLTGVVAVSAGSYHAVAVKADGTVVAWGNNQWGQLGDGTTTARSSPVAVSGLTGVSAVSASHAHTLALKTDGTVVAWGSNSGGVLGDGTSTSRHTPVAVAGLTGVVAVSAGGGSNFALKSDGTVVAWGKNTCGALGQGNIDQYYSTIVTVPGLTGVVALSASVGDSNMALKSDGTVATWGCNYWGMLGDGTTANRYSPVTVPGLTGVVAVAGGRYHSLAIKSDGTVMAWGLNGNQHLLGDGTTTERDSPVTVLGLNLIVSQFDCIFNWAEQNFAQYFSPAGATSATYGTYYYRYYSGTGNYLASSSTDNHVWVLGPSFGNGLLDVGPVTNFLSVSGCL